MKTDAQIQQQVIDHIKAKTDLPETEIAVSVKSGIVTLYGTVNTSAQKLKAIMAAWNIQEVKGLAVEIKVCPETSHPSTDTYIALTVIHALEFSARIDAERIRIKVEHKKVTLEGEVESEIQSEIAAEITADVNGVEEVLNNLKIVTPHK